MAASDSAYIHSLLYLSCQHLHNAAQWLIFTRPLSGKPHELEIGATDGFERMFHNNFSWEKLKGVIGERLSNESVVGKFREAFQKSHVQLRDVGVKLQVIVGPEEQATFELYETPATNVKMEIQKLLFALAGRCMELRSELYLAKGGEGVGASTPVGEAEPSERTSPKRPRRDYSKTSVINPGTRRRKAPTGLNYD